MKQLIRRLALRGDCRSVHLAWNLLDDAFLGAVVHYERKDVENYYHDASKADETHTAIMERLFSHGKYTAGEVRVKLDLERIDHHDHTELEVYARSPYFGYTVFVWWGPAPLDYKLATRWESGTEEKMREEIEELLAGGWVKLRDQLRKEIESKRSQPTPKKRRASK